MKNKSYKDKLDELQRKAVSIVAKGLDHPEPSMQFVLAVQYLVFLPTAALEADYTEDEDALNAEILTTDNRLPTTDQ